MPALTVTLFHILHNETIKKRLLAELEAAMPDPDQRVSCAALEALPYLIRLPCLPLPPLQNHNHNHNRKL